MLYRCELPAVCHTLQLHIPIMRPVVPVFIMYCYASYCPRAHYICYTAYCPGEYYTWYFRTCPGVYYLIIIYVMFSRYILAVPRYVVQVCITEMKRWQPWPSGRSTRVFASCPGWREKRWKSTGWLKSGTSPLPEETGESPRETRKLLQEDWEGRLIPWP